MRRRRPGRGGAAIGQPALGQTAHAPGSEVTPFFFPLSAQVGGGRAFPNSRPASFLARPQRVAMATQRPLPACGDAACLVASADPAAAAAATVGAHGGFG